jgi:hypothetical protein
MPDVSGTILGRPVSAGCAEDISQLSRWYEDMNEALINLVPCGPSRDNAINRLTESHMWAELAMVDGALPKKEGQ